MSSYGTHLELKQHTILICHGAFRCKNVRRGCQSESVDVAYVLLCWIFQAIPGKTHLNAHIVDVVGLIEDNHAFLVQLSGDHVGNLC